MQEKHDHDHHDHHHHRHHKRRHHHHHHHHDHSGCSGDDDMAKLGTIRHGSDTALAAMRALKDKDDRHTALGHMISTLIESGHIDGLSDVVKQVIVHTNRYDYIDG